MKNSPRSLYAKEDVIRQMHIQGLVSQDTYDYVKYMTSASTVYLPALLSAGIFSGLVAVAVNLQLIYGVLRRRRGHMLPWIVIVFLCLVLKAVALFAYAVVNMVYVDAKFGLLVFAAFIPATALGAYCWLCVVAHYEDLEVVRAFRGDMRRLGEEESEVRKSSDLMK